MATYHGQREVELEGLKTVESLSLLSNPSETAVSIITPARLRIISPTIALAHAYSLAFEQVTLGLLQSANELSVPSIWLQPGADDADVRAYIEESGLAEKVLLGGPCILRDGDFIRGGMGKGE